jgi:uncharacterized membrane protein YphA (DoxX/SURF4 family)
MKAPKPTDVLRISLAIIYIWFGILKPFGVSPAAGLVEASIFWWDSSWFIPVLGIGEVLIGICLLFKKLNKFSAVLLVLHMIGASLTPMFTVNSAVFSSFPHILTLEGQYIVKNLLIVSTAYILWDEAKGKKA